MTAFVANTNLLELKGLKSAVDDTFINDAAVTVTVREAEGEGDDDAEGAPVAGTTWPVTMTYVGGSAGDYRGVLSHEIQFVAGTSYKAFIEADAGDDLVGHWELPVKPATRKE